MSVKKCAREECGKTVYPIEELKCLDKVWHKQCFKCTVCGMTLNMKNYKGYDKKPYCEPHYPKTVASVVTDTPEMRRLAENTKNQSQVKYHEDYEKMRGTRIQIADDPEMARHLANSRVQSQVQYHGELEKKMHQEANRPREELMASGGGSDGQSSTTSSSCVINECTTSTQHSRQGSVQSNNTNDRSAPYLSSAGRDDLRMIRSMNGADDFTNGQYINQSYYQVNGNSHAAIAAMSQSTHASYSSPLPAASNGVGNGSARMESPAVLADRLASMEPPSSATDGLSPYSQRLVNQAGTVVFSSEKNGQVPSQERKIGSIADYDPMNGNWGSTTAQNAGRGATQKSSSNTPATAAGDAKKMATKSKGITVKAIYGYTAADTDEVSFLENDIIVNCEKVDDGWMTGTVQRTLQYGMLPANYVERVNTPTGLHRLH